MERYRVESIRHCASRLQKWICPHFRNFGSEEICQYTYIWTLVKKELDAWLLEGKDKEEDLPKKGKQRPINTSIPMLRVKYKWMTDQWRKITDIIRVGSGKSPVNEPAWFKILAAIFFRPKVKCVSYLYQSHLTVRRLRECLWERSGRFCLRDRFSSFPVCCKTFMYLY